MAAPDSDRERLHELGYAQELHRHMTAFSNFAVSFTIISVLSGCLTLYGFGMTTGGPALIVWGWPIVGIMTLTVGLAMAEVCSSYPTAGGLYYWSARLAPTNAAAWSWFTGWFNFLGQVAVTAGIDFGAASFLNAYLDLQLGFAATPAHTIALFGAILIAHGVLNTFGVRIVALLNDVSVWWHVLGVIAIVATLAIVPEHHQPPSFVFGEFVNRTGFSSTVYVALLGLLLAQYTLTGYDASAHMTEETHDAATAGPKGIVLSIVVSLVAGWVLLVGLTFAIQSYDGALASPTGVPPAQIFIDAAGEPIGKLLLLIAIGAQLFCGMASITANSRMIYAFSRDGALPASHLWHRINPRTRTPTNAVWLAAGGAFALGLPYLWNATAYCRGDLDRGDRPLHRLRAADLAPPAPRRRLRARPMAPRPVEPARRNDRRPVGGGHHRAVHAADGEPGRVEQLQLHADRGARGAGFRRRLVDAVGAALVHGPKVQGTRAELEAIERELERLEPES
jgi:amino acid transporter